jgi:hypothetical protein
MGNQQFKCPVETTPGMAPMTCVMACPDGFELRIVEGGQRCVSKDDPSVTIHLIPQPSVFRPIGDESILKIGDLDQKTDVGARYAVEADRFGKEAKVAIASIDHEKQVALAAEALKSAPLGEATDAAKARYMELTGDPESVAYQRDQVANTEVAKTTERYISDFQFLNSQNKQQQSTLDLITSVKDNIFAVKDDVEYSVGTFDKQVNEIRNQINMNKRKHEQSIDYGKWLSIGLNIAIVLALIFAIFTVGRKIMSRTASSMSSSSSQGAPARPIASPETTEFFNTFTHHLTSSASATSAKKG